MDYSGASKRTLGTLKLRYRDNSDLPFYNPYADPAVGDGGAALAAGGTGTVSSIGSQAGKNATPTDTVPDVSQALSGSTPMDPATLARNIDIAFLIFILAIALFNLPRAAARFRQNDAWRYGFVFRSSMKHKVQAEPRVPIDFREKSEPMASRSGGLLLPRPFGADGTVSHVRTRSWVSARQEAPETRASFQEPGAMRFIQSPTQHEQRHPDTSALPSHAKAYSSMFYVMSTAFDYRILPRFPLGYVFLLGIYTIVIVWATLFDSNLFTDGNRTAYLAISQLPIVVALATKNNIIGSLVGQGYQRLNFIHRYFGRVLIILVNIHAINHFYEWSINFVLADRVRDPTILSALVALAALDFLALTSLSTIRERSYNTFVVAHCIGILTFCVAVCFHRPVVIPYIVIASALYGLDVIMRIWNTRLCEVQLRAISEIATTRVEVPELPAGWRAGQHIRMRVLSSKMGWSGWTESHPFTISSASDSDKGLVLMCKSAGNWTQKLHHIAKSSQSAGSTLRCLIEGPYGGPGHCVFASFTSVLLVIGGSGISFALATIQELMQQDEQGKSRVSHIELVWSVRDPAFLIPMLPILTSVIRGQRSTTIHIAVHYTRASTKPFNFNDDYDLPELNLVPGRPMIQETLDLIITRFSMKRNTFEEPTGVLVAVCGPGAMADSVANVVRGISVARKRSVGGVELHEEVFGY